MARIGLLLVLRWRRHQGTNIRGRSGGHQVSGDDLLHGPLHRCLAVDHSREESAVVVSHHFNQGGRLIDSSSEAVPPSFVAAPFSPNR